MKHLFVYTMYTVNISHIYFLVTCYVFVIKNVFLNILFKKNIIYNSLFIFDPLVPGLLLEIYRVPRR